jgi:hypothetical protein
MNFNADDSFLRRAAGRNRIHAGVVHWKAFEPRENEQELSYTLQSADLKTDEGIDEFQEAKRLESGDLPGICLLTFLDLTRHIDPALPPRHEVDKDDEKYGHLHCCTDLPANKDVMDALAKLATEHGVVRDFVRAKKH